METQKTSASPYLPQGPLLWLDFETTGLDVETFDVPLEVAVLLTDSKGKHLSAPSSWLILPEVFDQRDVVPGAFPVDRLPERVAAMHRESGLLDDLDNPGPLPLLSLGDLDLTLGAWLNREGGGILGVPAPTLAGNSVHFDRRILRTYAPEFERRLHHRNLDVSAVRMAWEVGGGEVFEKGGPVRHRAATDVLHSLAVYREILGRLGAMVREQQRRTAGLY